MNFDSSMTRSQYFRQTRSCLQCNELCKVVYEVWVANKTWEAFRRQVFSDEALRLSARRVVQCLFLPLVVAFHGLSYCVCIKTESSNAAFNHMNH